MATKITLYLPDGYPERIDALMGILQAEGVDLRDEKRRVPSVSRLFRHLIDEKLEQKSEEDAVPEKVASTDRRDVELIPG